MPAKCENCEGQHLTTAANCSKRQREKTSTALTEMLRNKDEVVISCTSEMAVMVASRAREESAEKESAAAEVITERMKSSDEDSTISESEASVRVELAE